MNKKRFTWLIIMMVVSLAGITGVQIYWIKNAISIRNENFDNTVFTALHNVVGSLESSNRVAFFNDFRLRERSIRDSLFTDDSLLDLERYASVFPGGFSINITGKSQFSVPGTVNRTGDDFNDMIFDGIIPEGDSVTIVVTTRNESGILNSDENITIGGLAEERIVISQEEYVGWLKKRAAEFQLLSEQVISELSDWERKAEVDTRLVNYTLGRVFNLHGIKTPFEFAVIRDGSISGGKFEEAHSDNLKKSNYNVSLFPGRLVKEEVILSVVFPQKRDYVLGSIAWVLGSSLLFSLIVLATFAMSLYFILRQKKISEMRADFINNMTHEFKTPIATISLAADTITNPRVIGDEKGIRHFIGMIKKENSRMNRQVETILQIASLDKHEIQFRFGDVPLHSVIERAAEVMELQVQQRNGTITLNLEAVDSVIYGDPEHLSNLIHNLLDNANKYSPSTPEILVSTFNRDGGVVISVSDKGAGMSKTVQSRIFERFYRQPAGNIHNIKGFGLGLSYVKSIVDAHGGVIELTSEPGKGSRFDIYLPFNWES